MNTRGWLSWSIAAIFVLYLFLLQASTSVMVPDLMQSFDIDAAGVGLLSSSYFYTYIILQMPAGCIVERLGARSVLTVSMLGCAVAGWWFAHAHQLYFAEISRVLMGVFTASGVVGALYLAVNWFVPARFALLVGLTEMLGMLGGAVGQNILALGVTHYGWRQTMLLCSLLGLVLALFAVSVIRNRPVQQIKAKQVIKNKHTSMLNEFWQVLKLPQAWVNGVFSGLVFAVLTGFAALWSVPYLMALYKVNLSTAAGASSMVFWGAAFGGPFTGWLSAHLGKRCLLMFGGTLAALVICLIVFYCPNIPLFMMFFLLLLLGFFCSTYVLPFAIVAAIVPAPLRCTAMGFTNMMCIVFGAPLMQPLIGWLLKIQHTPSIHAYQLAFAVLPMGLLGALLCVIFIREIDSTSPHTSLQ